jgi:subtilisin family serine protease/Tol biopolymer transport system component
VTSIRRGESAGFAVVLALSMVVSLLVVAAPPAAAYPRPGVTELISTTEDGSFSDGRYGVTGDLDMTSDGRYVAFVSDAPLVSKDTATCVTGTVVSCSDVYVKDRSTSRTTLISVNALGAPGDSHSSTPSISDDGRYVAFQSTAKNLVPGDTNGRPDIFVHDRDADEDGIFDESNAITVVRASVSSSGAQAGGASQGSTSPSISSSGRFVAFESRADNLVPGDTNLSADVFVRDLQTQTTSRVSVGADGAQAERRNPPGLAKTSIGGKQAISADGRHVIFQSDALGLVQGASTTNYVHVYLRDRDTDADGIMDEPDSSTTIQINVDPAGKSGTAGDSGAPLFGTNGASLSDDGRLVAFQTDVDNLAPGESNLHTDVYVRDRDADDDGLFDEPGAGNTTRVSVTASGTEVLRGASKPSFSPDGRFVSFLSHQHDVIAGDTNGKPDIFVHDLLLGTTERVSISSDGTEANHNSPTTTPIQLESTAAAAILSAGGRYVAFTSQASNLVPGQTKPAGAYSEVFVRDRGLAVGTSGLGASASEGGLSVTGSANLSGLVLSSAMDAADDGLPGAFDVGAELTGARVIYRPELEDVLLDVDLAHMPQVGIYPRGSFTPGVVYGLEMNVGSSSYEVRATGPFGNTTHLSTGSEGSPLGAGDRKVTTGLYELYECTQACVLKQTLEGGLGITGHRVRVAVPLEAIGAAPGASLTGLAVSAAIAQKTAGPNEWDSLPLPDAAVPAPEVTLGIAGEDVLFSDVVFDVEASEPVTGSFTGTVDTTGLTDGYYRLWAKACLGPEVCGASSIPVTIGSPDPRPTPTPTEEPTPSPSPTDEPTPTPTPSDPPTSSPSPSPSPTPTVSPSPTSGDYPMNPDDSYFDALWGTRKINAPAAWQEDKATGAGIKVAVVDSGTDVHHADLQCPGKLILVPGADLVDDDDDPDDRFGHGTHVAGTVGACTNNKRGIAGVAPDSRIIPIRVLDAAGSGSFDDIAAGITKATEAGAHVINLSLSGNAVSAVPVVDFGVVDAAIEAALAEGVVVVAAAGNSGIPLCEYPALAKDVVCVGATDARDVKAWYSSFPNKIASGATLVAPGGLGGQGVCALYEEHIFSLYPKELDRCDEDRVGYQDSSGTSMAAPHVSGAAALIYERLAGVRNPANAAKVVAALEATAHDLGTPGWDPVFGSGRIDALAAVTSVPVVTLPDPDPTDPPDPDPTTTPAPEPLARTQRVSETASGVVANDYSYHPSFSADGNHIVFTSSATNLVTGVPQPGCPGGGISCTDIFVKDLRDGKVTLVSVASDGTPGNAASNRAAISADGSVVVFDSAASNLVPGDTNFLNDVFVHDRDTDKDGVLDEPGAISTTRISAAADGRQIGGSDRVIDLASISPDGRYVAFSSNSSIFDPADQNGRYDVFLHDRVEGTTERISVAMDGGDGDANASIVGVPSAISEGGRYVSFYSDSANLVPGDTNHENPLFLGDRRQTTAAGFDVFVRDTEKDETVRVSVTDDGEELPGMFTGAFFTSISADGRIVAFSTLVGTKLTPQDGNSINDIYVRDRDTDRDGIFDEPDAVSTRRVSVASDGSEANGTSVQPTLSAGGRYVAFLSSADNLVAGDSNEVEDAFVHDLKTGLTERISVTSTGAELDADAHVVAISGDGRRAAFWTLATNLPGRPTRDYDIIYMRERGPAVGVGDLTAVVHGDELRSAGWANLRSATMASLLDPRDDGSPAAAAAGGQMVGADIEYRAESNEIYLRTRLTSLASADPRCCVNVNTGGAPGVVYGVQFLSSGVLYEARISAASGNVPSFELYECLVICQKVRDLSGSFGTMGSEVSVVIPRSAIQAGEGDVLTETVVFATAGARAFASAPLGNSASFGYELDTIHINEMAIPSKEVSMAIAPAGTDAADVDFSTEVSGIKDGVFSSSLDLDSLADGGYELWARACIGDECGAARTPFKVGDEVSPSDPTTSLRFSDLSATTGQYSDDALLEVHLADSSGAPIPGAEVIFTLTGDTGDPITFASLTDEEGRAASTVALTQAPGSYRLQARFAGEIGRFDASSAETSFSIDKEDSVVTLRDEGRGANRALTAHLGDLDTPAFGIGGRTIVFFADGEQIGSASTDDQGLATLQVPPRYRGGSHNFEAVFDGDTYYRPSRAEASSVDARQAGI